MYEQSVVAQLLSSQFYSFVEHVKTTDCQAELRRLVKAGPPFYISDKHAMPLPDCDAHIVSLWYASDPTKEISTKLDGAVEGDEREKLWKELKGFIIVEGKEPDDEDREDAKDEA